MDKCPFCGSGNLKESPCLPHYECESWVDFPYGRLHRGKECYEREIANLTKRLAEAEELLMEAENVAIHIVNYPLEHEGELIYTLVDIKKDARVFRERLKSAIKPK